jgi:hypothetical protein
MSGVSDLNFNFKKDIPITPIHTYILHCLMVRNTRYCMWGTSALSQGLFIRYIVTCPNYGIP